MIKSVDGRDHRGSHAATRASIDLCKNQSGGLRWAVPNPAPPSTSDEVRQLDGLLWWFRRGKAQVVVTYTNDSKPQAPRVQALVIANADESSVEFRLQENGTYAVMYEGISSRLGFSDIRLCQFTAEIHFYQDGLKIGYLGRDGRLHGEVRPVLLQERDMISAAGARLVTPDAMPRFHRQRHA
ncbi:MAG TPA: hypothetical protein V6D17_03790 [Candidatus Obscuribacterales bacterium]